MRSVIINSGWCQPPFVALFIVGALYADFSVALRSHAVRSPTEGDVVNHSEATSFLTESSNITSAVTHEHLETSLIEEAVSRVNASTADVSMLEGNPLYDGTYWHFKVFLCVSTIIFGVTAVGVWHRRDNRKPFKTANFLPPVVEAFVPEAFRTIVDLPHLVLICLFWFGAAIVVEATWSFSSGNAVLKQVSVLKLLCILWIAPCMCFVYGYIYNYDDREGNRRQQVEKKKTEMIDMYDTMLLQTETKLKSAQETSAGLAEANMNGLKRDFVRFLGWISTLGETDSDSTSETIKRYIGQWLGVFEETTLDPIENPRRGGSACFIGIFDGAESVSAAATELKGRLQDEQVGFISEEKQLLEQMKEEKQATFTVRAKDKAALAKEKAASAARGVVSAGHSWSCAGQSFMGTLAMSMYPFKLSCCCAEVTVFSRGHIFLMSGVIWGPVLICLYQYDGYKRSLAGEDVDHVLMSWSLSIFTICLAVCSIHYESIDKLMTIQHEIQFLDEKRDDVIAQRVRIADFFGKTQAAIEVWQHRTIPLLELMNEFQQRLRDQHSGSPSTLGPSLDHVCKALDSVRDRVGTVAQWHARFDSQDQGASSGDETPSDERSQERDSVGTQSALGRWVKKVLDAPPGAPADLTALVAGVEQGLPELRIDFVEA